MHRPGITGSDVLSAIHVAGATRTVRVRLACLALVIAAALAVMPSVALGDGCPSIDDSYTGNCGPEFDVPSWTDAGGWNDPSQYSTIKLADLNGDGKDELIGRSDAGIEIYRFDTTLGQWRPQVDANGVPQLLKDFASFLPAQASDPHNPNQPQFYSTIQAADVDGQPGAEILARFWDGMRVYKYAPPTGTNAIDGGTWSRIATGGPFSDADGYADPSLYTTIGVARFSNDQSSGAPWNPTAPMLFARQHGQELEQTVALYTLSQNGTWNPVPNEDALDGFGDADCGTPSCYLTLQAADVVHGDGEVEGSLSAIMGHRASGVDAFDFEPEYGGALWANPTPDGGPLTDEPGNLDCPFTPITGDCLGSSPSYYETMRGADVDGKPGDELLARASDGLRVKHWVPAHLTACCVAPSVFSPYATLTALGGAASSVQPGAWGSIRTGDINGDHRDEVLALDGTALQAWSYDPGSDSWSQLPASTPLALGSDPWLTHPEYFSTIQVGDVDGDGRDDVIARGPSGIRTWFYDRRHTGGWERYLPDGYPAFAEEPCPAGVTGQCGEAGAYAALNALVDPSLISSGTLRDLWSGENAPQPGDVSNVVSRLPGIANCAAATGSPPQVAACTPPAGSTGFNATQWTAVVNEMLSEADAAGEVLAFFGDLKTMRDDLFLQENAELPAIGDDLALQAAAGNTAQFNPLSLISGGVGIAASLAGLIPGIGPALSAALWVGAEAASMIPQTSPTATSSALPSTYSGLKTKFATMVSETVKGLTVTSQEVRQDASLLGLVSSLRRSGPWASNNLDMIGLQSAANQAFALWVYQTLVPTVYDRYAVSQCAEYGNELCYGPAAGTLGVIGGATSTDKTVPFSFIALGPQRSFYGGVPCDPNGGEASCNYTQPPPTLMTSVWGTPSPSCSYVPGQSKTAWTFGCNAGADVQSSIGANTWNFTSYSGGFEIPLDHCGLPFGGCPNTIQGSAAAPVRSPARTAQALGARRPIRLALPRSGRRRAVRGRAQIQAEIALPRGMRLAGATVRLHRLLFEPGFRELTAARAKRGEQPLTLKLSRAGAGRFAAASGGRRWVRVTVRRRRGVHASLTVRSARVFHAPRACHALPAAVALRTQPLWLQTRLVLSDGRHRAPVQVDHHVRCRRDARANVNRLEYVRNPRHRQRPGLALTLRGPSSVTPGATISYVARVHNQRHGRHRLVSSLWDITLIHGARTNRIHELRRGRTRSVRFTVRVPSSAGTRGTARSAGAVRLAGSARGRFCVGVAAAAPGARADSARVCSRVRAALPPRFTG